MSSYISVIWYCKYNKAHGFTKVSGADSLTCSPIDYYTPLTTIPYSLFVRHNLPMNRMT